MAGGRLCRICSTEKLRKTAAEAIAAGLSDNEVAKQLGFEGGRSGNQGRMAVWRHRKNCVEAQARAVLQAVNKGRDVAEQRRETIAAAEAGDPSAFLGLGAIVDTLRGVSERLERQASAAEGDGHNMAIASLSAQQLRAVEVRARLGNTGGYAPPRVNPVSPPTFSVNFVFSGEGRQPASLEMQAAPPLEHAALPLPGLSPFAGAIAAERAIPAPHEGVDDERDSDGEDV